METLEVEWSRELELIRGKGVALTPGLSSSELCEVEARCGRPLPLDLAAFLSCAVPVAPGFPNWRVMSDAHVRSALDGPREGIAFDIEHNSFWWPAWGERPRSLELALAIANEALLAVPRLIPIYGHRYIPCEPSQAGNPVFSVVQTDIILYGRDLRSYLTVEFGEDAYADATAGEPRRIRFWSDLVDWNDQRTY